MARLELSFLGPFRAALDGKPVTGFESNKVRALLAYLTVEGDRPHSREALAGLLWPGWSERAARNNLRNALSNLRSAIGDRDATALFLEITRETIQFDPSSDHWLDVEAFREATRADQGAPSACHQLEQAIALYGGRFLEGFSVGDSPAFEEWALLVREQLQRQALAAHSRLTELYERQGEFERACVYARRQVEIEPYDERAHRQMMRLLALSGQRGAALSQYETCRRVLTEELGTEPSVETTALYERIRSGQMPIPTPASRWERELPRHNLPASITPFIGRQALLSEVRGRLQDPGCRLLTLIGPGGSGKTRLALEAAWSLLAANARERYPDGVYFVSLAPLRTMDAIVPTVAQALGLSLDQALSGAGAGPLRPLLNHLHQKRLLLILDNLEHLIARPASDQLDGAQTVGDVLRAAPHVSILATSRTRLSVQGEQLLPIPGMDVPPDPLSESTEAGKKPVSEYSAVQLFLDNARRLQPDYQPAAEDLNHIARICQLVSGMPLAILLAAAWTRLLSPAEIAAEISGGLGRAMDLLETDGHDVPARQRSMRAVFDHSYALLSEGQREVLGGLSVFRGSFTPKAAQAVTGASLRELAVLVDMSLLQRTRTGHYALHELLRQYAAEKLGTSEGKVCAARNRHAAFYAAALERWARDLKGNRDRAAQIEIDREFEDVRAAWEWAAERGETKWLGQAFEGLYQFCVFRRRFADGEAMTRAAARSLGARDAASSAAAQVLQVTSRLLSAQAWFQAEMFREPVAELLQTSLALLERKDLADTDTRSERAFTLLGQANALGYVRTSATDLGYTEADELCERSVALYQKLQDHHWMGRALITWATICGRYGQWDRAQQMSERALVLYRTLGNDFGTESAVLELVWDTGHIGQFEKAERLARQLLAMRQKGSEADMGTGLASLGLSLWWCGRYAEAVPVFQQSVDIYANLGLQARVQAVTWWLAWAETHLGRYETARARAHAALDQSRASGLPQYEADAHHLLAAVALAEEAHEEAWRLQREGHAVAQEMAFGPLALGGYAARGLGRTDRSAQLLWQGVRQAADTGSVPRLLAALPGAALALADQGETERAVELYALATRYGMVANSRWFEDIAGRHIAAAAEALPLDAAAAARERGQARDLWATVQELLAEPGEEQQFKMQNVPLADTPQPCARPTDT